MAMKALVYNGPGKNALEDRPVPELSAPTDAIVKMAKTTICGTDKTVQSGKIEPTHLITHHFVFDRMLDAYATFEQAAKTQALKVIIDL